MPRPKKGSPEAKEWAKKMKEARSKKEATSPSQDNNDVAALLKRIEELEARNFFTQPVQQQVKSVTKASTSVKDYPDPRERLYNEEKLNLKDFNKNWWFLDWRVAKVNYDKDSVHYVEPRFELELWKWLEQDDGTPSTTKRYKICVGNFFEDHDSFVQIASEKGIEIPEHLEQAFFDEMRYLTIRDWLIDCFYPPKPAQAKTNKTETVIGNRLVEVVEINSADTENAFKHLTSRV